jgi:hypothetical protein
MVCLFVCVVHPKLDHFRIFPTGAMLPVLHGNPHLLNVFEVQALGLVAESVGSDQLLYGLRL